MRRRTREDTQIATRPQLFAGLDKDVMPEGPRAAGPAWLGLLLRGSTFRVAGAYLQFAATRHWPANLRVLRDRGWGIGGIYLGDSRESYVRKVKTHPVVDGVRQTVTERFFNAPERLRSQTRMTAARGTANAQEAKRLAAAAGLPAGSVIWFDNEDPDDVVFADYELAYYAAFLAEIVIGGGEAPAYRPGLYAHQRIAAQLLARHQELWIWEVDYGNNVDRVTQPPMRTPTPPDRRFGLDPTNADAVVKAFRVFPDPANPGAPWGVWPVWRQWQGNNNVDLPARAIGDLTPVRKWDWNSSLVRDPSDPRPVPRLAVAAGGPTAWVARVDDLDATVDATGRPAEPRRGRLTMVLPIAGARPVDVDVERGWHLHPSGAAVPVTGAGVAEMIMMFTLNELGSTVVDARRRWTPVRPLWTASMLAAPRLPHSVAAVAPTPRDLHLVWAATGNQLWTSRRALAGQWGEPARMGGELRLHPFGLVAVAALRGGVHVLTVDEAGRLVHENWTPPAPWPATRSAPVDTGNSILPAADLALIAGDADTLIAVAIGPDLRLRRWIWATGGRPARWSPAVALGRAEDTVHPQTAIGVFCPRPGRVIVTAIAGDGAPRRFTLDAGPGWVASTATRLDLPAPFSGVHPLTDLPSLPDGRFLASVIRPGEAGAAIIDPANRTGVLLT